MSNAGPVNPRKKVFGSSDGLPFSRAMPSEITNAGVLFVAWEQMNRLLTASFEISI